MFSVEFSFLGQLSFVRKNASAFVNFIHNTIQVSPSDYRPLSHGGHFESHVNKKLCFCTSSLALDERLAVQKHLFQHCVIKVNSVPGIFV